MTPKWPAVASAPPSVYEAGGDRTAVIAFRAFRDMYRAGYVAYAVARLGTHELAERVVEDSLTALAVRWSATLGCSHPAAMAWRLLAACVDDAEGTPLPCPGDRICGSDAHVGGALLETDDRTAVLQADMRDTQEIFDSEPVRRLIDFREPVAALFVSVLHCIPDADRPVDLIRRVRSRLASGSVMVICQLVSESEQVRDDVSAFMDRETRGHWGRVRTRADVESYFEDNDLSIVEPGLVEVPRWHPAEVPVAPPQQSFEWEEFGGADMVP